MFAKECNIVLKFSSPRYAQSNGLAEKGVAITKNILKRCMEICETEQFQHRILEYNSTPKANMSYTPSELFLGRIIKTKLPISGSLLCRNNVGEQIVQRKIEKKKQLQKYYYDKNAKILPTLNIGESVIFKKNGKEWSYGTVTGIVSKRSYIVKDCFENEYRRNRRFIAKTSNKEFDASELLIEENVNMPNIEVQDNIDNLRDKIIGSENINIELNSNMNVYEPKSSAVSSQPNIESANDSGSKTSEDCNELKSTANKSDTYSTRSGRIVRPPKRYGHN